MSNSIYKYVGPGYMDKVFESSASVTLKCSQPKDFNDPYELFLTIDFNERPDALAFYADAIGELPQLPTTCFSRSPSVIPMWAHYAQNLQGFAIEFDEEKLAKSFPESGFGNVDYLDVPNEDLTDMLYRAYEIGKFRYTYFLNKGVFSAAYYTKASCWSYEQERRMVVRERESYQKDGLTLIDVPNECITALICGPRASPETALVLREKATQLGCKYFQIKIGRSSAVPFFVDASDSPFVFNGTAISSSSQHCSSCKEPLSAAAALCSWCQIDESHKARAAARNPYRLLNHYGMLGTYIADMEAIGRGEKK